MLAILTVAFFAAASSLSAQSAYYSGAVTSIIGTGATAGTLVQPYGVAEDSSGNVYVTDVNLKEVLEFKPTNGAYTTAPVVLPAPTVAQNGVGGWIFPVSVAIDNQGNVWVADNADYAPTGGGVYSIAPGASTVTLSALTTWVNPQGVAADSFGNVFATDSGDGQIWGVAGDTVGLINTQIANPYGITVDPAGNLWVVNGGTQQIDEIPSADVNLTSTTFVPTTTIGGFGPSGTVDIWYDAIDQTGNLWALDKGDGYVAQASPNGTWSTIQTYDPTITEPGAIAWDNKGNLLVANEGASDIQLISAWGVNFGSSPVGTTASIGSISIPFTVTSGGTLSVSVVTERKTGSDFADTSDTCTGAIASATTCTVNVSFTPSVSGVRYGAVELLSGSTIIATAYLSGTGTGPQIAYLTTPPPSVSVGTGFTTPAGLAVDSAGIVFTADTSGSVFYGLTGGTQNLLASIAGAAGVAVNAEDSVFVAATGGVYEIPFGSVTATTLGDNYAYSGPKGVAVDQYGNVFVADTGNNAVEEAFAESGYSTAPYSVGSGFSAPAAVAVDGSENVFVADTGNHAVKEVLAVNGALPLTPTVTTLGSGFSTPVGIAVDANDNVYVADSGLKTIVEIPFNGTTYGTQITIATLAAAPTGVAVDENGNVYYSAGSGVAELTLATPPTLTFEDTVLGTLSADSPKTVAVENIGNTNLVFTGLAFPSPATYFQNASSTCTSSSSLVEAGSCDVIVDFDPTASPVPTQHVTLTDNTLNVPGTQQQITLNGTASDLTISSPSGTTLTAGTVGTPYTQTFTASGSSGYTWTVSGQPAGLTMDSTTGVLSGTPTAATTTPASVDVTVTDTNNLSVSKTYSLTINKATPTVTAADVTANYSATAQNVTLTATVVLTGSSLIVDEGTVTFSVYQGATQIGVATAAATVTAGAASATFSVPAGQAAGTYTIHAAYADTAASANFNAANDNTHTLTIGSVNPTIAAANATATYSTATQNVTLNASVTISGGTVNEGTVTFTILQGTTVIGTAVTSGTVTSNAASATYVLPAGQAVGSYTIKAVYNDTGGSFNTATDTTHTLTITAVSATVTAANISTTFAVGTQNVTLTATVTSPAGTVNEGKVTFTVLKGTTTIGTATTSATVASGAASVSYALPAGQAPGTYTIQAAYNDSPANITTASDNTHTLTITAATAAIAAANVSATYSASAQSVTLTAAVTSTAGVVGEGTVTFTVLQGATVIGAATTSGTVAAGAASVSYALPAAQAAGSYTIKAVYNDASGDFTSVTDSTHTLTITQATVTLSVTNSPVTYSGAAQAATVTGSVPGTVSNIEYNGSATAPTAAGTYAVTANFTPTDTTDYATLTAASAGNFVIAKATPTLSVTNSPQPFTGTPVAAAVTGSVPGTASAILYNGSATVPTAAGTYAITANFTPTDATDYASLTAASAGNFIIGTVAPTITFTVPNHTYGDAPFTVSATSNSTGAITYSVVSGPATIAGATVTLTGAGSVVLKASQVAAGNYLAGSQNATFTVSVGTPTITWSPAASIAYGTTLAGELNATAAFGGSSVAGTFAYTATPAGGTASAATATTVLQEGTYTLTATFTPTDTTDYKTATKTAPLTVTGSTLTVSANNATKVYGTANPTFSGSVTGQQNGDTFTESFTTTATASSNVGTYPIVPSVTGSDVSDYTVVINDGTLTVTQAGTTTSLTANSTSVNPGATVTLTATVASATTGTPTGTVTFYNGSAVLGTGTLSGGIATYSTTTLAPGSTVTLTAVYGGDTNFTTSSTTSSISITVAPLGFTLTASPGSQTGNAGTTFTYQLAVAPTFGAYPGAVSFAANGGPAGATISFTPSTLAASAGATTVSMAVATSASSSAALQPISTGRKLVPVAFALLLLPLAGTRRMRRNGRWLGRFFCLLLLALGGIAATTALTGCGSNSGGTTKVPQGTQYTITVQATSGTVQQSTTVTLTIE